MPETSPKSKDSGVGVLEHVLAPLEEDDDVSFGISFPQLPQPSSSAAKSSY